MATQLIRPAGCPVLDPGLCPHTSTGTHTERGVKLGGEGGGEYALTKRDTVRAII